jgi:hypothetical protein
MRFPKKVDIIIERHNQFSKKGWSKIDKFPLKSENQTLEAFKRLKSIQNASPKVRILVYTRESGKENSWKDALFAYQPLLKLIGFQVNLMKFPHSSNFIL